MMKKKKRFFWYHEGVGYYVPLESIDDLKMYMDDLADAENLSIEFVMKRMTDKEFENLPVE